MDEINLSEAEERARQRVIFALDYPTVEEAIRAAEDLGSRVGHFKIGMELHTAAGAAGVPIVEEIFGYSPNGEPNVFLDLKYHDIPQTVYGAARAAARMGGVSMFNIHVAGGEVMCRKAVEAAQEGATLAGHKRPYVIGVTVLTSLDDEDLRVQGTTMSARDLTLLRTELAMKWGLDGVVAPANSAGTLEKEFGTDFIYVTPGVRWRGLQGDGQKQLYTPDQAVQDCSSSRLVIGSAIRKAQDPRRTAYEILQAMAPYV